jgi:hypothetical protein
MPAMARRNECLDAVREVAARVGAALTIEQGGKHIKCTVEYGGRRRLLIVSATPSACRAATSSRQLARRVLRQMGATV